MVYEGSVDEISASVTRVYEAATVEVNRVNKDEGITRLGVVANLLIEGGGKRTREGRRPSI